MIEWGIMEKQSKVTGQPQLLNVHPTYDTPMSKDSASDNGRAIAKIVQFADESKTLPDGSKIIYAENDEKIVLYQKKHFEKGKTYVYERKTGKIFINGKEGSNEDKREMIRMGAYMLGNCKESDMVTISIQKQ